jgi:hypothetical protein
MKRLIFVMIVVAFSIATAQAQEKMSSKKTVISIAGNIGIPTTTGLSLAYGGDLQADFGVASGLKITVSGGYESYSVKGGGHTTGLIPLLAGAKFNLGSDKLYGHAQLGYGLSTIKGGGGAFTYAPSLDIILARILMPPLNTLHLATAEL